MLCPFCLHDVKPRKEDDPRTLGTLNVCPREDCAEVIPSVYVRDYDRFPPVVVSVVGHRAHGKTVALAALFYTVQRLDVSLHWRDFFFFPLDEDSLATVYDNVDLLAGGSLPNASPKIFPRPTIVHVGGVPHYDDATLLFYDTAGEAFSRASDLGTYASFVRRAETVLFLVSIPRVLKESGGDLALVGEAMQKLLFPYVQAMADFGEGVTQRLLVVYTCGDEVVEHLGGDFADVHEALATGVPERVSDEGYDATLADLSDRLRTFTSERLRGQPFINLAEQHFEGVDFAIISALGSAPDGEHLVSEIAPRRIFDPVLWLMQRTRRSWLGRLRRWRAG
jgi:hypothetical protein